MVILNEAKPKYEKLDELLEPYLINILFSNQINIIIDLKELLKKFFRPDITIDNYVEKILLEEISSDILNTIAHYRNYFYKKGKYSNFFLLYSKRQCSEFVNEFSKYKEDYYAKYFNNEEDPKVDIIRRVVSAVEKVVEVIPNAFFYDTSDFDEFLAAKYIISNKNKNELCIILSNDQMFYQLVSNNVIILNLKGIKTELINPDNVIKNIINEKDEVNITISNNLLPLVFALSGIKKYSIKNIPGFAVKKSIKLLEKLKAEGKVDDLPSINIPIDFSKLGDTKLENELKNNAEIISKNYSLIRGDEIYAKNKIKLSSQILFTKKEIGTALLFRQLNSNVFTLFPLLIDMLLKGEM